MSFMVVKCPWCGETYTFGMVGRTPIGSGHTDCDGVKPCDFEGCEREGQFLMVELVDPDEGTFDQNHFRCAFHMDDLALLAGKPRGYLIADQPAALLENAVRDV